MVKKSWNLYVDEDLKKRTKEFCKKNPSVGDSSVLVSKLLHTFLDGGQDSLFSIARKVRSDVKK